MVIHDDFIFVHLGKNGGHFINEWSKLIPGCVLAHHNHTPIIKALGEIKDDRIKWGITRNPFDWYVSWWASTKNRKGPVDKLIKDDRSKSFRKFLKHTLLDEDSLLHKWIDFEKMKELDIGLYSFYYLKIYCDFNRLSLDSFSKEDILLDEELEYQGFRKNIEKLFNEKIFKLNKIQTYFLRNNKKINNFKHKDYREYYDDELIDLVHHKDRLIFKVHPEYLWKKGQ